MVNTGERRQSERREESEQRSEIVLGLTRRAPWVTRNNSPEPSSTHLWIPALRAPSVYHPKVIHFLSAVVFERYTVPAP